MKKLQVDPGFLKDWKKLAKKHYDKGELNAIVELLTSDKPIPFKFCDHSLSGNYKGYRECHIHRNWLLIYQATENSIILIATGTHDDLFK